MTATKKAGFNPADHFTKLKSKDYLPVAWRLVWFRERYPNGTIDTEIIQLTDTTAVIRATVTAISEGGEVCGRAMGTKAQSKHGFSDFIEKAETGAIGRALAGLGFGTQFDPDLDEGERLADAPVERQNAPQQPAHTNEAPITDAAMKRLHALLNENGLNHAHLTAYAVDQGHKSSKELTMAQATKLGNGLKDNTQAAVQCLTELVDKAELAQAGMDVGAEFDAQKAGK